MGGTLTEVAAHDSAAGQGVKKPVSLVVTVFNERENVRELHRRVGAVFAGLPDYDFELIFVEDGSTDGTAEAVAEIIQECPHTRLLRLSRNFGHQICLRAGIDHAAGEAIITMDGDLQHPPETIPRFLEAWRSGHDVVCGRRRTSGQTGWFKRAASRGFYWLINRIGRVQLQPGGGDFRLLDRRVVEALSGFPERAPFVRGLVAWMGFQHAVIEYDEDPRRRGKPAYNTTRLLRLAVGAITSFSALPLRLSAYLGFITAFLALAYAAWAVWQRLFTDTLPPGWASVLTAVLFLGGVQLISIGVLGEYLYRVYEETKGRPLYLVMDKKGFGRGQEAGGAVQRPPESRPNKACSRERSA